MSEQVQREGQASGGANPPPARIIKRYSNRKLYDTVESRYVTLPQIAVLVRNGEEVRIIDNNSKEDLTSVTLAQILYEEERKQSRVLPLDALKNLLHKTGEKISQLGRRPGKAEGEAAPAPVETPEPPPPPEAQAAAAAAKDGGANRWQELVEQSRVSVAEWQQGVEEKVRRMVENLSPSTQIEKLQAEVRKLQQRVDELEKKVGELE